jgi:hypothetical protein
MLVTLVTYCYNNVFVYFNLWLNLTHVGAIGRTREEGKAFVHANCELDDAIQVNKSGLTLECCIWFCSIPDITP